MRVSLAYSVDLKEVPTAVGSLLTDVGQKLKQAASEAGSYEGNLGEDDTQNALAVVQRVDELRQLLAKLDLRLADCSAILSGYLQATLNPPAQSSTTPGVEEQETHKETENEQDQTVSEG